MKKISLYIMSLLALGFTACTEDFNTDVAQPQSWEQEAAAAGMSFATTAVTAIDLGKVTTDSVAILTFTPPTVNEGVEISGYDVLLNGKTTLQMSKTGKVKVSELQAAVVGLYGKRPLARTMSGLASALVSKDGQVFRLKAAAKDVIVTPKAPFIDTAYYIIGDMNQWNGNALIKLNQSGKDVYEDPIFSVMVKVGANNYWKVIPQINVTAGNVWNNDNVLGTAKDGDDALTGTLVLNPGNGPGAMKIVNAGWVRITLNMMEYTYTVEELGDGNPYLYVAGNHQGWDPGTAPAVFASDFVTYKGFVSLDGAFKFTSARNWNGTNYGNGGAGLLSTDPTAGNLSLDAGFYLLEANISDLTWKSTAITTWGLIGDATTGGWDTSTPMTFDPATVSYSVTTTLKAGSFKFRANNGWDINLGGSLNGLTFGGENISATAGTYQITLNLSDPSAFKATVVAK